MYEFSPSPPLAFPAASDPPAPASDAVFSGAAGTAVESPLDFFLRALLDSPVTNVCSFATTSEAISAWDLMCIGLKNDFYA